MRTETLLLDIIQRNGRRTFIPHSKHDDERHNGFLLAQTDRVEKKSKEGKSVVVKVTYEIVSEHYVEFSTARSAYYAYLGSVISKGHEEFTKKIGGENKYQRVENLHLMLKNYRCETDASWWWIDKNDKTGAVVEKLFSLSDWWIYTAKRLSETQAMLYMSWAKEQLYEMHKIATADTPEGAWSIPYWME